MLDRIQTRCNFVSFLSIDLPSLYSWNYGGIAKKSQWKWFHSKNIQRLFPPPVGIYEIRSFNFAGKLLPRCFSLSTRNRNDRQDFIISSFSFPLHQFRSTKHAFRFNLVHKLRPLNTFETIDSILLCPLMPDFALRNTPFVSISSTTLSLSLSDLLSTLKRSI